MGGLRGMFIFKANEQKRPIVIIEVNIRQAIF